MEIIPYQRQNAIEYAKRWAHQRNSIFQQAEPEEGDGASFFSQCLLAGGMEPNPNRRAGWCFWEKGCSPAFCRSKELSSFLLRNRGPGPFAEEVTLCRGEPGDLVQLWSAKGPFQSLLLLYGTDGEPLVAAHSFDLWMRPLKDFSQSSWRFFHILGCWR